MIVGPEKLHIIGSENTEAAQIATFGQLDLNHASVSVNADIHHRCDVSITPENYFAGGDFTISITHLRKIGMKSPFRP